MTIQRVPLNVLHQPDLNVRKHTDKQIAEYVRSLRMFGQVKPVIVDENYEIICGNGLYLALMQMSEAECDCYVITGLTPSQKKKLMLADNRVYELGVTDIDTFEEIVHALGDDIDVPGWDSELLATLNASMSEVDDMVSGYGTFASQYTDRVKEAQPQSSQQMHAHVSDGHIASSASLQQSNAPRNVPDNVSTSEAVNRMEQANPGQIERFVVCPKCGERICL